MMWLRRLMFVIGALCLVAAHPVTAEERVNVWNALDANPSGSIELPRNNPNIPEIWMYSDKMSYAPGDDAIFYVHTNAKTFSYTIERDGAERKVVASADNVDGMMQKTQKAPFREGAGWKESFRLKIPTDWQSGVYIVRARVQLPDMGDATAEHFFVVRAAKPAAPRISL